MRAFLALFAGLLFLVPARADSWITINDPNGRFTVMFPFTPLVETSTEKLPNGRAVPMVQYVVSQDQGRAAMVFTDSDHTGGNIDPQKGLDAAVAALTLRYKVQTSSVDNRDGQIGRFVTMTDSQGTAITDRAFFFGEHLYQAVTALVPAASAADLVDVQRFSSSVHLHSLVAGIPVPGAEARMAVSASPASLGGGSPLVTAETLCQLKRPRDATPTSLALTIACRASRALGVVPGVH